MTIWVNGLNISGHGTSHTGSAKFVAPAATTDDDKAATPVQGNITQHSKKANKKRKNKTASDSRGLDKTQKFFYSAGGIYSICFISHTALARLAVPSVLPAARRLV